MTPLPTTGQKFTERAAQSHTPLPPPWRAVRNVPTAASTAPAAPNRPAVTSAVEQDGLKPFFVVQFNSTNDLALVCKEWVRVSDNVVYWPPFKNPQRINKAVAARIQADEGTWTKYSIAVLCQACK